MSYLFFSYLHISLQLNVWSLLRWFGDLQGIALSHLLVYLDRLREVCHRWYLFRIHNLFSSKTFLHQKLLWLGLCCTRKLLATGKVDIRFTVTFTGRISAFPCQQGSQHNFVWFEYGRYYWGILGGRFYSLNCSWKIVDAIACHGLLREYN